MTPEMSDRESLAGFTAPVDLTNCDREPIHIPGAIQPHGALLGVRESDSVIVVASSNAAKILRVNSNVVGATASELLGQTAFEELSTAKPGIQARSGLAIATRAGLFDATVHRSGGLLIIELEPSSGVEDFSPAQFRDLLHSTLQIVEQSTTLHGLATAIAEQMRLVTSFDRVWVYRFHDDWHGEIIGESMTEGIEPWLGLHYPASDIPAQARELFLRNWLRMIPDVSFVPVPLEPQLNPLSGQPLDLGNSVLRSVSPIHIQYLSNMGVAASLVVSLVHQGKLWGLISGHHYSGPKHVPLAMRTLCEFLAQALSLQVGMAETVDDKSKELKVREVEAQLRRKLPDRAGYRHALLSGSPNLLDLVSATGAALCDGDDCSAVGNVPTGPEIAALVKWLHAEGHDEFRSTMLSRDYPPAIDWKKFGSGLLALALSPRRPHYVLWFRPELKQTIRWAGDPKKAATVSADGVERLSPRGSFSLWEEERRGTSDDWDPSEVQASNDLRRTILDFLLKQAEELATMNAELEATNDQLEELVAEMEEQTEELVRQRAERERILAAEQDARTEAEEANRAKAEFLAMMSHELRTPLNAIGGYAQMMELGIRGPVTDAQVTDLQRIQHSQRYLLGLINNILNFAKLEAGQVDITILEFDVGAVVEELKQLVIPQLGAKEMSLEIEQPAEEVVAKADPEKFRQIVVNLLSNAIKFSEAGSTVTIEYGLEGGNVMLSVSDTGRGIPEDRLTAIFEPFIQVDRHTGPKSGDGIGLGLSISRDLARKMGGDLTATSVLGSGSTFTVTVPGGVGSGHP